ncbi:MAG: hypothetical protein IPP77_02490 [Bacteroidetes bacterium]|nr:hypothetical protein [Bacteroidota bacterium]
MLAYNRGLLDNTFLLAEAESLKRGGFINTKQLDFMEERLPAYHTQSNLLIRIGLFILGCFLFSSCCGTLSLFFMEAGRLGWSLNLLLFTAFGFIITELLIGNRKYFGNGADDAFLLCSQLSLGGFIFYQGMDQEIIFPALLTFAIVGVVCCIRYVDSLSALLACLSITGFVAERLIVVGDSGKLLLPFVLMVLAAGMYYMHIFLKRKNNLYYRKSLLALSVFSMILFYLAGNYLIVREGTILLLGSAILSGGDIPFAFLFYTFTFLIPVGYIFFSLKQQNRQMLWAGFASLGFSIFTVRHYYQIIPVEVALIGGGLLLLTFALLSMRALKGKPTGLTFESDRLQHTDTLLDMEALAVIQSFAVKPARNTDSGHDFGGGSFGGGGGGGTF